ncbi:uncharacterized protein LOC122319686 [Drosophila yakuba]|uniref:uncharacterized protein LOC122319686 n=1 Tax=Drosophila yakuba TaxID=7245 RepID=UPI001C8A5084|nr:uncharacterized protein LOC122319686 [Drosophila yakuba]
MPSFHYYCPQSQNLYRYFFATCIGLIIMPVSSCVHCFRYKPVLMSQIMGNLPADRVRMERPFLVCGVNFCGPFYVSLKVRGRHPIKTYVAVFVCFSSKAVHLELLVDLSTDSFLSVFKRSVQRAEGAERSVSPQSGRAQRIRSSERRRVVFHVVTSHFGGLWEAAVKSAKTRLLRGVGNAKLTTDELSTHLVEVEALLNSRPIASPGNDPNDGEVLTPGHLLIGQPLITLPQESGSGGVCSKASCAYLKRWRILSALKQQFWDGWSQDYIASLQQRNKWSVRCRDLEVGCLVVVHKDNVPPQRWLTGRVVATTAGEDGRVRVAEVRTSGGVIKRAVHKLALLPVHTAPVEEVKEPEVFNGAGMLEQ